MLKTTRLTGRPLSASKPGDGTGIVNGVVAEGTEYGVRGRGLGKSSTAETAGVLGESTVGYGVRGESTTSNGVRGTSTFAAGVSGSGTDVGVEGAGTTGVVGRGETGVQGNGSVGFGVDGHSKTSAGVHGSSDRDRGGVFESKEVAQVRLVPRAQETQEPQLSRNGKVGDLFLIRHNGTRGGQRFDSCSLWLCVPENPSQDDSSQWQQVMLGPIVTSTG
jgi:hypothetical protein